MNILGALKFCQTFWGAILSGEASIYFVSTAAPSSTADFARDQPNPLAPTAPTPALTSSSSSVSTTIPTGFPIPANTMPKPTTIPWTMPEPTAIPWTMPEPTVIPLPQPEPTAIPWTMPEPTAIPLTVPEPTAIPYTSEPTAIPLPQPEPTAIPLTMPEPTAVPLPQPKPTAIPLTMPEPTAIPYTSEPTAIPLPQPEPTAIPLTMPEPTAVPLPQPEPTAIRLTMPEPTAIIPLTTSEPTGIPIPMRTQEPTAIIPLTTSEPTGIPIPMRTQEPTANDINGANNGNEQNDHDLEKDVEEPQQAATSYTEAPTRLYTTSSPSPYFDGACSVGSEISCRTSGGQSCDYIMGPSHFVCDSYDGYADSVSFMVTGNTCAYTNHCEETYPYQNLEEQQYYVLMQHGYDIVYEGVVEHGRIFTVDARDCGVVTIVISTVPVGFPRPGLPLQVIHRVPLSCLGTAGRDLTLSEDFGALRVVSFSNLDQGVQSIVEEITLTYTIHNYGRVDARVDEAMVQNDFDYEMLNLMEDCEDPTLPAGEHISFDSKPYIVNVVDRNGQDMYTAFLAVQYDNCGDRVRFAVQLADAPETREPYNYPTDYPRTRVPTTPHYYHTESPMTYMPNGMASEIRIIVTHVALQGGSEWRDGTSYQAKAIQWLENDKLAYDGLSQQRIWQRYALACIYFATYAVPNPYTVSSTRGWIDSAGWLEPISECEWFGVNCTRDSFVESLDLSSNRLTGTFPNETMILAGNLTYLDLFQNPVHNHGDDGHIWLIEMYKLQHLFYGSTNFEYHHGIPFYLMELTNLVEFDCSNTLYSGPIEPELFVMWERMEWLSLGGNVYNSTIPMEIGMMPNLQHLYMGDAHLVGGLYFLESMVSPLVDLWLGNNPSLGGTIPTSIAHSPFLESLSLSGCGLSGTIPAEIGLLRELKFLWLFDNMLTGTIPFEMGDLFQLQILELEDNMLMGIMPDQVCSNTGPDGFLSTLEADCGQGNNAYIECSCCTCCVSCGAVPSMVPIHGEMDAHGMRWPRRRSLH